MKRRTLLALACIGLFILGIFILQPARAQNEKSGPTEQNRSDQELAATIRGLTNRSVEDLVVEKAPGGGLMVNLQDRFQNVMLAKMGADGDLPAACITTIDEADAFFGRNLETGEPVDSSAFKRTESVDDIAARHGMSADEIFVL